MKKQSNNYDDAATELSTMIEATKRETSSRGKRREESSDTHSRESKSRASDEVGAEEVISDELKPGTVVRIASAEKICGLPKYRWIMIYGRRHAEDRIKEFQLWSGLHARISNHLDPIDRSYNVVFLDRDKGKIVRSMKPYLMWWPYELLILDKQSLLTPGNRLGGSARCLSICILAQTAMNSNVRSSRAFWKNHLPNDPYVCLRRDANDPKRETLIHKLVRSDKTKSLKALIEMRVPMDARMEDAHGDTAIQIACSLRSYKTIALLIENCASKRRWIKVETLVQLTQNMPFIIVPYLEVMGFGKEGIDNTVRRFPFEFDMDPCSDSMYVHGSNSLSNEDLWERERQKLVSERRLPFLKKIVRCIYNLKFAPFTSASREFPVRARVIACKNIAAFYDEELGVDKLLNALQENAPKQVFATKVLKAVLDFKWKAYIGIRYRWYALTFTVYVVAMTCFINVLRVTDAISRVPLQVLVVLLSFRLLLFDAVAIYHQGLFVYFSFTKGKYWNTLRTICLVLNLTILVIDVLEDIDIHIFDSNRNLESLILSWSNILMWFNALGLYRPLRETGPFVSMIEGMISGVRSFAFIFFIVIWAFAQSFFTILPPSAFDEEHTEELSSDTPTGFSFENLPYSITSTLLMSVGEFADFLQVLIHGCPYHIAATLMFVLFLFVVMLILLNLLLVIMLEAYNKIINGGTETEWRRYQCLVTTTLEKQTGLPRREEFFPAYIHILEPNVPSANSFAKSMSKESDFKRKDIDDSNDTKFPPWLNDMLKVIRTEIRSDIDRIIRAKVEKVVGPPSNDIPT
eukprot:g2925.t1